MSGFKKVIQRHPYRERSAPKSRKHFGLLEKHKDYSLRAASFNKKKAQLASLREKAANRNEDEFYFGMLSRAGPTSSASTLVRGASNRSWTGTVNGDRGNTALDMDTVRLLKTQDIGYVRTMRNVAAKEVRVLKQKVVTAEAMAASGGQIEPEEESENGNEEGFGFNSGAKIKRASGKPKKIVFVDDADERDERIDADTRQDDDNDEAAADEEEGNERCDPRKLELQRLKRRVQNAEKRLQVLAKAEQEMEQQRARMAKTPTKGVVTKKGQKLKVRERKR